MAWYMLSPHLMLLIAIAPNLLLTFGEAWHPFNIEPAKPMDRRTSLARIRAGLVTSTLSTMAQPALAKTTTVGSTNPRADLVEASETLDKLLTNWKRATIDCTFADVPRELLEQKNKELLLEKASTFALFDKSVSVETCKTTNRIVRDYLGVTGKGPLVGLDKKLKAGLDFLDDSGNGEEDPFGAYVAALEAFSQSYSKATSLSYAAGIADVGSVNNFSKEEAESGIADSNPNSNLNQAKAAIVQAKTSLDIMISLIQKG